MKRVVEYLGSILAILLILAAAFTYVAPHLGWRVDIVVSGSMEPELKVGSLAITHPVDPEDIAVGDIITFNPRGVTLNENMVSHRVVNVNRNSPLYFETKGDANAQVDPFTVPARNLVGRVDFHTPYLGYVAQFLRTTLGFVLGLVLPGLVVIFMYIRSVRQALRAEKEKKLSKAATG